MSDFVVGDVVYVIQTTGTGKQFWASCTITEKNENGTYNVNVRGMNYPISEVPVKNMVHFKDMDKNPSIDTSDSIRIKSLMQEKTDLLDKKETMDKGKEEYQTIKSRLAQINQDLAEESQYLNSKVRGGIGRKSKKSKKTKKTRKLKKSRKLRK